MDKATHDVIKALIKTEYKNTKDALSEIINSGRHGAAKRPAIHLAMGIIDYVFRDDEMLPKIIPSVLEETIDHHTEPTKVDRLYYAGTTLLQPLNYLSSFPMNILLANFPLVKDGIKLDRKNADGEQVIVSVDTINKDTQQILDDAKGFVASIAKYVEGMAQAYRTAKADIDAHPEANPLLNSVEDFVEKAQPQAYALMWMLAPTMFGQKATMEDIACDQDTLRQRYHGFAETYITGTVVDHAKEDDLNVPGREGIEYSNWINRPIDLILNVAQGMIRLVGDFNSWSGIIRFFGKSPRANYDIVDKMGDANKELFDLMQGPAESLYQVVEDAAYLVKLALNDAGKKRTKQHIEVIEGWGRKEQQKDIIERYTV